MVSLFNKYMSRPSSDNEGLNPIAHGGLIQPFLFVNVCHPSEKLMSVFSIMVRVP